MIKYITIYLMLGLIIFFYIKSKVKKKVKKTRIKYAVKCGKVEHKSGRWLGVFVVLTLITLYFKMMDLSFIFGIISVILWLVYIISHSTEKKLYPNNFRG